MNRLAIQPHLYSYTSHPSKCISYNPQDQRELTTSFKSAYASLSKTQKAELNTTNEKTLTFIDPYERQFTFSLRECGTWAGMQRCIEKAMRQVRPEGVRCDYLVGDGEIILKEAWEGMVRGGMCVKAGVWPEETKVGKGVRS